MFLGLRKPYFLGIDFGTSLIKVIELTLEDGKPKLVKYGQVDLSTLEKGKIPAGRSYDDEVVLYLKALLKRFQPKSKAASVAMPAFIGLVSLIEFPEMEEKELQEAIQFEAHKYIPSSLNDVALSWEVVGRNGGEGGSAPKMEVLLVAALNKEVARYKGYMESVHLKMDFLELETFSLVRSLVGRRPGVFLIIDIGSRATNLALVDDGLVKVSRNIDVGGKDITHTISESLGITFERAENLKRSEKNFLTPESNLIFPALQTIASEGERMLSSYRVRYTERECDGAILSGGTAQFTGLAEYYAKLLNVPVSIGTPWERIVYEKELTPVIEKLGTSFSVAIGLALVGIDAHDVEKKDILGKPSSLKKLLLKKL